MLKRSIRFIVNSIQVGIWCNLFIFCSTQVVFLRSSVINHSYLIFQTDFFFLLFWLHITCIDYQTQLFNCWMIRNITHGVLYNSNISHCEEWNSQIVVVTSCYHYYQEVDWRKKKTRRERVLIDYMHLVFIFSLSFFFLFLNQTVIWS